VKREQRLRAPADFRRVREFARSSWLHPLLVMYVAPTELNRVRRRLREAIGQRFGQLPLESDVVVAARPASAQASWDQLCGALDSLLARAEKRQ